MSSMFGGKGYRGATGGVTDLKGTGHKQIAAPQFTKEQVKRLQQMFSMTKPDSQLGRLASGDQSQFGELEAPALQQFNQLQGGLASRFSGMGGLGARNSSGFQNTANSAAQDFASQLQSQRLGIQNQARNDLFNMSRELLGQRPFQDVYTQNQPKQPGFWKQLLMGSVTGAAKSGTQLAGNAASAAILA